MNVNKMRRQLDRTAPVEPVPGWAREQAAAFAGAGIVVRDAQAFVRALVTSARRGPEGEMR